MQYIVLLFTTSCVLISYAIGKDYYVSPGGSDNDAGTEANPWKTIGKANSTLIAGDIVYIKAGTYKQQIRPANSGSAGNYITYKNDNNDLVTITDVGTGINLDNRQYIKIDGITLNGFEIGNNARIKRFLNMQNGSYNIIQNCLFQYCVGWAGVYLRDSDHNKFVNNVFKYCGNWAQDKGDMLVILHSSFNLFEGNDLSFGGHTLADFTSYFNVIRNNYWHNGWERNLGLDGNTKYDKSTEDRNKRKIGGFNLFENNILTKASKASDDPTPPTMKIQGRGQIVRRNLFYNNIGEGFTGATRLPKIPEVLLIKIYQNVFYKNGSFTWRMTDYGTAYKAEYNQEALTNNNIFKNNVCYKNGSSYEVWANLLETSKRAGNDPLNNNQFVGNCVLKNTPGQAIIYYKGIGTKSIPWYQSNYPNNYSNNIEKNPLFVDANAGTPDFHLQANSPCIDAGVFLTKTTAAGSGTKIEVEDPGYFSDGFDIIKGDIIQLEGQVQTARIVNINYALDTDNRPVYTDNIITLDRALIWSKGQGVSLAYQGSGPDIGAYEYDEGVVTNKAEGNKPGVEFGIGQIYPNPFNLTLGINYYIPSREKGLISIAVFNLQGKLIKRLVSGRTLMAGWYSTVWDGIAEHGQVAPSGVYIIKFTAGDFEQWKGALMLK